MARKGLVQPKPAAITTTPPAQSIVCPRLGSAGRLRSIIKSPACLLGWSSINPSSTRELTRTCPDGSAHLASTSTTAPVLAVTIRAWPSHAHPHCSCVCVVRWPQVSVSSQTRDLVARAVCLSWIWTSEGQGAPKECRNMLWQGRAKNAES